MINLSVHEIEKLIEDESLDADNEEALKLFVLAINDWPGSIINLEEYVAELEKFIEGNTTKVNILATLKTINLSINSWQAESLYQIVEIFKFFKDDISLYEIVQNLELKYKK